MIVNDVINANPEENYISDHLMAHLQKGSWATIILGESKTTEGHRV